MIVPKSLSVARLQEIADENGEIRVEILVSLSDLLEVEGMDGLNELADEKIVDDSGVLSDIRYKMVGTYPENKIILEVRAKIHELRIGTQ